MRLRGHTVARAYAHTAAPTAWRTLAHAGVPIMAKPQHRAEADGAPRSSPAARVSPRPRPAHHQGQHHRKQEKSSQIQHTVCKQGTVRAHTQNDKQKGQSTRASAATSMRLTSRSWPQRGPLPPRRRGPAGTRTQTQRCRLGTQTKRGRGTIPKGHLPTRATYFSARKSRSAFEPRSRVRWSGRLRDGAAA